MTEKRGRRLTHWSVSNVRYRSLDIILNLKLKRKFTNKTEKQKKKDE